MLKASGVLFGNPINLANQGSTLVRFFSRLRGALWFVTTAGVKSKS